MKEYNGQLDLRRHTYLEHNCPFSANAVVERARGQIQQCGYNALIRNCETFAVWCKLGKAQSVQSRETLVTVLDFTVKAGTVLVVVFIVGALLYLKFDADMADIGSDLSKSLDPEKCKNGCETAMKISAGGATASAGTGAAAFVGLKTINKKKSNFKG